MDEQIKTEWCDALRSGKFKQGRGQLKYETREARRDEESVIEYCCLGVLTNLYCRAKKKAWNKVKFNAVGSDGEEMLPDEVMKWAKLDSCDPIIKKSTRNGNIKTLSQLNDKGISFEEIADKIEKKL